MENRGAFLIWGGATRTFRIHTEETTIRYVLPEPGDVRFTITDGLGRVVREVEQGRREAGEHTVMVSTASLASGTYLYHVESGGRRTTRQMMVVR
jgi:serine protease AprX